MDKDYEYKLINFEGVKDIVKKIAETYKVPCELENKDYAYIFFPCSTIFTFTELRIVATENKWTPAQKYNISSADFNGYYGDDDPCYKEYKQRAEEFVDFTLKESYRADSYKLGKLFRSYLIGKGLYDEDINATTDEDTITITIKSPKCTKSRIVTVKRENKNNWMIYTEDFNYIATVKGFDTKVFDNLFIRIKEAMAHNEALDMLLKFY